MMSTSPTIDLEEPAGGIGSPRLPERPLLICLPSMPSDVAAAVLQEFSSIFSRDSILVALPDQDGEQPATENRPATIPYHLSRGNGQWVLTAEDYAAAAGLVQQHNAYGVILLGNEPASLRGAALQALQASLASGTDLALPRYRTSPDEALVNSALLYPMTRALFSIDARFPLPLDTGLSPRMAARLAQAADRPNLQNESGLIWPVGEAATAGYSVREVEGGLRALPHPQESDLNELFPAVTSSLFADVESKATYWQRARALPAVRPSSSVHTGDGSATMSDEVRALIEAYRIAFNNLREIWALVLPPQSLLALKKLANSSPESFSFPPSLWARTVYDFALAFRLRTLNRGHLLGSLTPLYLAWVASFLRASGGSEAAGVSLLELTVQAFEQEKPYLVSRWRWPDRFNP